MIVLVGPNETRVFCNNLHTVDVMTVLSRIFPALFQNLNRYIKILIGTFITEFDKKKLDIFLPIKIFLSITIYFLNIRNEKYFWGYQVLPIYVCNVNS